MSLKKIVQARNATVKTTPRQDTWASVVTGLGMDGQDKSVGLSAVLTTLSQEQAEIIWRSDDVAARIIERLPEEMTREGFELEIEGKAGKDQSEELMDAHDELQTLQHLYTCMTWERAYSGSALLLGADDGQADWSIPLNEEGIRSFDWMLPLTARECVPFLWYDQPGPKFGQPRIYQLVLDNPGGMVSQMLFVHESRIIPFQGVQVSRQHRAKTYLRWGDSVLVRVLKIVQQFQTAFDSSAVLMDDFAQAIFKMKGLADMVANEDPNDPQRIRNRVRAVNYSRSNINAILLDADGEDFQRHSTQVTGLPDLLDKFSLRVAAAADTPVTILMGQSPAGLNATGASDIRFWYDRVKAKQVQKLNPPINRITELKAKALGMKLDAPEPKKPEQERMPARQDAAPPPAKAKQGKVWSITHRPLWQLTELERAELESKVASKDKIYVDAGVLTAEEVALSRFRGDKWSMSTTLETEDRHTLAEENTAKEAEAAKLMTEATTPKEKPPAKKEK